MSENDPQIKIMRENNWHMRGYFVWDLQAKD